MNKKINLKKLEHGQVIPIVVIGIFVIIMMSALIIDGGMVLSHHRTAQAAADAGAMAGASYLCPHNYDHDMAVYSAETYVDSNNADLIDDPDNPNPKVSGNSILVKTVAHSDSFFARIFGHPTLQATAEAEASCLTLGATEKQTVLPVAFPCIPSEYFDESEDYYFFTDEEFKCSTKFYGDFEKPTDEEYSQMIEDGYVTIIMDTDPDKAYCKPDGPYDCDVDGDGRDDIVASGSRGWLALEKTNNPNDLKDWINNGFDGKISVGYWLSTVTGVNNSIFNEVRNIEGDTVILPYFNAFCRLGKPSVKCNSLPELTLPWREGDYDAETRDGVGHTDYRIVGFGRFVVACVHATGQDKEGSKGSRCAFRNYLIEHPDYDVTNNPNVKSIEGYFIESVESVGGSGGQESGTYIIQLTK